MDSEKLEKLVESIILAATATGHHPYRVTNHLAGMINDAKERNQFVDDIFAELQNRADKLPWGF